MRISALCAPVALLGLWATPDVARSSAPPPQEEEPAPPPLSLVVDGPPVVLHDIPFDLDLQLDEAEAGTFRMLAADGRELAAGELPAGEPVEVDDLTVAREDLPLRVAVVTASGTTAQVPFDRPSFPGWVSLLPPVVAIALALVFREVVVSLFFGIWIGALFVSGLDPLAAIWRTVDTFVVPSIADPSNASILVFSALLGMMVGVMSRSGGTRGIVEAVRPLATTPRRAQLATYLAGIGIFFDDYANTLIVGNTFRPITDRLRISREKLAYIVDSTAAPVVAIVFVSTWVGFEISLIRDGLRIAAEQTADPALAAALASASPFTVFLHSVPYLFYPILALLMVGLVVLTQRDFGPMHAAEVRARRGDGLHRPDAQLMVDVEGGALDAKEGVPHRWVNAVVPVLTVVVVVLLGLYFDGRAAAGGGSLWDVFGAADPFKALLWGSLAGCIVAIALALGQRILTLNEALEAWLSGGKAMMMAFVILVLAWSLGEVTAQVGTAPYLTQILRGNLDPHLLPVLVSVTAAAISFATGTSWATMTILLPLVVPLIVALGGAVGFEAGHGYTLLLGTVSSVLAGSIFGDHCSPISDTTVLSSMASASDHIDHVRTQLPYALAVATVAFLLGDLATAYGLHPAITYVAGGGLLFALVRFVGKPAEEAVPATT